MSALLHAKRTERIVMDVDEVAVLVGVSRKMVYDQAGIGALPCRRLGRRFLFYRPAILAWLAGASSPHAHADNDNEAALQAEDVAALLDVDRKTVYEAVARGELPHRRIGRRVVFSRPALVRWLLLEERPCSVCSHTQPRVAVTKE